jgi:hypothetical protein
LLLAALAGCTTPPPAPAPAPVRVAAAPAAPAPPPRPAAPDPTALADAAARHVLAYSERLRQMGTAELALEQARLGDAPDTPAASIELALLLAHTHGDTTRALALLEPLARASGPAPWQAPARLLQARLLEQRRLEEQAERQAQQLRDQQRRIDQLTSQLEALKAIERSLNAPRPAAAPASAASRAAP